SSEGRAETAIVETVDQLEVGEATNNLPSQRRRPLGSGRFQHRNLVIIVLALLLGLAARVYRLDASGLAEDEANKIFAVRSYLHGDFAINSEHPMLMKTLCLSSIGMCRVWNDQIGARGGSIISEETALRLPNPVIAALTVIPLFLLANALFEFRCGLITAFLWALGGNAIWFNRVTKEDTLMVFFMLCGYAIYNRAKTLDIRAVKGQERLYCLAGVAFGLMISSKYFPHYYGLMALFYHLAGYDRRDNRPLTRRMKLIHGSAILLTFLAFNFAILLPSTWSYLWKYVHGDFFTHHGYVIMDHVYPNSIARTPNGSPWFFYWLYLLVKLPPAVLGAFVIGVITLFRRPRSEFEARGHLFLRIMLIFWLIPMSLIGVKFLRYTLAVIPFVYMTASVGALTCWRLGSNMVNKLIPAVALLNKTAGNQGRVSSRLFPRPYTSIGALPAVVVITVFVLWPAATALRSLPYPALYTNSFGAGRVGYFFPHDEFYDVGARESIEYIAEHAPSGVLVACEIPE